MAPYFWLMIGLTVYNPGLWWFWDSCFVMGMMMTDEY